MLTVHFLHKHGKMTIKVVYPSTGSGGEDTKDVYYNPPQSAIENFSSHDMCIVLTDAKATIASSSCDMMSQPYIKGNTYVGPVTNDNGEYLLFFCCNTYLCIGDTWYPCKYIHHWSWNSSDSTTRKAVDHILISHCWQSCIINCRVYWGTQLGNTDHQLLAAQLRIKLKSRSFCQTQNLVWHVSLARSLHCCNIHLQYI